MDLSIQEKEGEAVRISAAGRITQDKFKTATDPLCELLGDEIYDRNLLIDLRQADFVDSSGINWLLKSHKKFKEKGHQMVLHSIPPVVKNAIRVLRLDLLFAIADSEAEAIRLIQSE